jgi:methyl-accepting chemotaxis protein
MNGRPSDDVRGSETSGGLSASLVEAIVRMSNAHRDGDVDARLHVDRWEAGERRVAEAVNAIVELHAGLVPEIVTVLSAYANGDCGPALRPLPGRRSALNERLDALRAGLMGLQEANAVLQRIQSNDYTTAVSGKYSGIFASLASEINEMRARLLHLQDTARKIAAGDLSELAAFKAIGNGLGRRSDRDELVPAYIGMMESLQAKAEAAARIAAGEVDVDIHVASSADALGQAMVAMKHNVDAVLEDAGALTRAAMDGQLGVRADPAKHKGEFRKVIEAINGTLDLITRPFAQIAQQAQALGASSEELSAISHQMAGNAEETSTQVNVVSAATEEITRNLTAVAASSEEMQASIREISKSASEAARMAKGAHTRAQATKETVHRLGDSSADIGKVVKVITTIAQQTNLLALNATIEAARAGEAGKGFAVVAQEVKELARQTASATEDIHHKIETIQTETVSVVSAIDEIGDVIAQIDDASATIASAVEEQTATTNEIGRNISEAARGGNEIARNVGSVATAAAEVAKGADETQKAAGALTEMAGQLQAIVGRFSL